MRPSQAPSTPSGNKVLRKGLFRNGVWHCNCIPRLPAVLLQVKKDTRNKGRSFYTCQKDKDKKNKCDFFLWAEDAYEREVGSVLTNARSEAEDTPSRKPKKRQRTLHESITPAKEKRHWSEKTPVTGLAELNRMLNPGEDTASATAKSSTLKSSSTLKGDSSTAPQPISSSSDEEKDEPIRISNAKRQPSAMPSTPSTGSKRKRPDVEEYSDFSSGEEEELVALANSSEKAQSKHRNAFETPTTSRTKVKVEDGMPTPLTDKSVRRVLFAEPEVNNAKRSRTEAFASTSTSIPQQSSQSPSSTPSSSQQGHGTTGKDVTQEVMALLDGQKLDNQVLRDIHNALEKHAAKAKGLERGRDASREAVKKAEARVAELQQRVADLENQRRLDSEARVKMRSELMKLYRDS
ncbi:hypothetical protein F5Y06DRAFT_166646 [Hypoxylon sp. FL0890]|nr:hypothetical protein F5Y06DRAFT_166646 [Hypoxylon sp. FL0890]